MKTNNVIHKILVSILCIILFGILHQIIYLFCIQSHCHKKIMAGQDLNWYETACVLQTHTNLWLIGWLVEPNTAEACFCKQFHCAPKHIFPYILEDSVVINAKQSLKKDKQKTRLCWKEVNTRSPILLNGASIRRLDVSNNGNKIIWEYTIPMDFAPGMFKVGFISLSESSFDYLEKKGILSVYTDVRYQEDNINKPWYVKFLEKPLPIYAKTKK